MFLFPVSCEKRPHIKFLRPLIIYKTFCIFRFYLYKVYLCINLPDGHSLKCSVCYEESWLREVPAFFYNLFIIPSGIFMTRPSEGVIKELFLKPDRKIRAIRGRKINFFISFLEIKNQICPNKKLFKTRNFSESLEKE